MFTLIQYSSLAETVQAKQSLIQLTWITINIITWLFSSLKTQYLYQNAGVLLSAGTELGFFPVAGTALCSGVSIRIMVTPHWCFGCCYIMLTLSQRLWMSQALPARRYTKNRGIGIGNKGTFHSTECHAQYINSGRYPEGAEWCVRPGWALIRGW